MSNFPSGYAFYVDPSRSRAKLLLALDLIDLAPVAIGTLDPPVAQTDCGIAIGDHAGYFHQGQCAIAIGREAGTTYQGTFGVALGVEAGTYHQGSNAIAVGIQAGQLSQSSNAVAIGTEAGQNAQAAYAVAIGAEAGWNTQGANAIAIGRRAGQTQQIANSIILNATGVGLNAPTSGLYVAPIRPGSASQILYYNTATDEVLTGSVPGGTIPGGDAYGEYLFWDGTAWAIGTLQISLGSFAGSSNQGSYAVALGYRAGELNQRECAIAIGANAGQNSQSTQAIAIGCYAGNLSQGTASVAVGLNAGQTQQGSGCVAIGDSAGANVQNNSGVAIGYYAGNDNQQALGIAIGDNAGYAIQGFGSIAVGYSAGQLAQQQLAIAIGSEAGKINQKSQSIAIGFQAGYEQQNANTVAIGYDAGRSGQCIGAVAVGYQAGDFIQGTNAIAMGNLAGQTNQGTRAVAIGNNAGNLNQGQEAVAIGAAAGLDAQRSEAIAIGANAGQTNQGISAVAIGANAGANAQNTRAIAIGNFAGNNQQGTFAIAIGAAAGLDAQRSDAIAIGANAGQTNQGQGAIAIGANAGTDSQESFAIAIGAFAGQTNQPQKSIVVNASGASLNTVTQASALYIHPIRSATAPKILAYEPVSKEVTYSDPTFSNVSLQTYTYAYFQARDAVLGKFMFTDCADKDAFYRLRVSEPTTLYEGNTIYDANPVAFDNDLTANASISGPGTSASMTLTVNAGSTINEYAARQTHFYAKYQPGKSFLAMFSFCLGPAVAGVAKRVGLYDVNNSSANTPNNGVLLEYTTSGLTWWVYKGDGTSQSAAQAAWNVDPLNGLGPSGVAINPLSNLLGFVDLEWLGVGRVRTGFFVGGVPVICNVFNNASFTTPYINNPLLPVRYEVRRVVSSATAAASLTVTCCTILSEGGYEPIGVVRTFQSGELSISGTSQKYVLAVRLISSSPRAILSPVSVEIVSDLAGGSNIAYYSVYLWRPSSSAVPASTTWTAVSTTLGGSGSIVEYSNPGQSGATDLYDQMLSDTAGVSVLVERGAVNSTSKTSLGAVSTAIAVAQSSVDRANRDIYLVVIDNNSAGTNKKYTALYTWREI